MPIFLLSALGWAKQAFQAALAFVLKYPLQCALVVALVAVAWLWRANGNLREHVKTERAAHAQTIVNYRVAQKKAEAVQAHNLTRVKTAQDAISERVSNDFEARLADARARYERLRAGSDRSASGNAGMPATSEGTARTVEAASAFGLSERLLATENAIQLDELITWVEAQSAVATSPDVRQ